MRQFFSFPSTINEKAARVVAAAVLLTCVAGLSAGAYWLFVPLAYGFWARVLTGPKLSPLGRLASSVLAPRLGAAREVPGPPKRFAQLIGAVVTSAGAILAFGAGLHAVGDGLFVVMIIAAGLESVFALCLGCELFGVLIAAGLVPPAVCAECSDLRLHWARTPSS